MTHPETGPSTPGRHPRPAYYWELDAAELHRLREDNLILEDEGYLAHDINRGRRILDLPDRYAPVPDVDPDWEPPADPHRFSDAIAAVLQAAVDAGYNPVDVCNAALLTQSSVRSTSTTAIRPDRR